ncbi:MAG: cytochrome P450 [Myxococcales bacterium]|nr:cytochrome P450 [Myxococcales bacterium]
MTTETTPAPIPKVSLFQMLFRILFSGREERINMRATLSRQYDELGPVVLQDVGIMKMVNLFGPDANRLVLLDPDRIFSARRPWMQIMGRIFPNGLLLQDGGLHKHHRQIMHMPFKRPALRIYGERMGEMIDERLSAWAARTETDEPLLAFPAYKALTLDMAAAIFIGVDLGPSTQQMNQAFEDLVAASMSRLRLPIPGLEFYRGLKGREFMLDFLGDLLPKKRAGDGLDMLTRLCHAETEEGERFSDQEILDHMIFLMMAAHDTTTSTLCSMTYELARNPDWQERVREECRGLGSEQLAFDQLDSLESLSWVMKETLRLYPPLPIVPRVATEAFRFGGYEIAKNSMVVISPIHTHRMPEWWDDPGRFDPERFSPERAEHERHSHSWVPFGGGAHMCLGLRFAELQVMAVIHQLVQRFRIRIPDGYEMPVQQAPISKPRDGLPIQLEAIE